MTTEDDAELAMELLKVIDEYAAKKGIYDIVLLGRQHRPLCCVNLEEVGEGPWRVTGRNDLMAPSNITYVVEASSLHLAIGEFPNSQTATAVCAALNADYRASKK
jgi:hypothetical protein